MNGKKKTEQFDFDLDELESLLQENGANLLEEPSIVTDDEFMELSKKVIAFLHSIPDGLPNYDSFYENKVFQNFRNAYESKVPADRAFTVKNFHSIALRCFKNDIKSLSDEELRACFQSIARVNRLSKQNMLETRDSFLPYFEEWINRKINE